MKHLNFLVPAFAFSLVMIGCGKEPVACITADEKNPELGGTVTVTDCTTDGKLESVDFGEAIDNTGSMYSHIYEYPGTYTIKATSTNPRSDKSDDFELKVEVKEPDLSLLLGRWNVYKYEEYKQPWEYGKPETTTELIEEWKIETDSIVLDPNDPSFSQKKPYSTGPMAAFSFRNVDYHIVKLTTEDMVLEENDSRSSTGTFKRHYLLRP